jgi:hypothetical protein
MYLFQCKMNVVQARHVRKCLIAYNQALPLHKHRDLSEIKIHTAGNRFVRRFSNVHVSWCAESGSVYMYVRVTVVRLSLVQPADSAS